MKKLVLSLAVLASVALVSCGGGEKAADTVDSTNMEAPAVVNDSDSANVQAEAPAQESGAATTAEAPAQK